MSRNHLNCLSAEGVSLPGFMFFVFIFRVVSGFMFYLSFLSEMLDSRALHVAGGPCWFQWFFTGA